MPDWGEADWPHPEIEDAEALLGLSVRCRIEQAR